MSTWKNELLPDELPFDKFKKYGAHTLSDSELLAIILRTGTKNYSPVELSRRILNDINSNQGLLNLCHVSLKELLEVPGIGEVKAIQLLAIAEIAKRISLESAKEKLDFSDADTVAAYYMEKLRHEEKEHIIICMLDNKCNLIKDQVLFIGTINSSLCSTRDIFINALRERASYIIILHNHPSGDPMPSMQDRRLTDKIYEASKLMDIPLIDHIIIGDNQYFSFNKLGLI